jgi:hypothetical protein
LYGYSPSYDTLLDTIWSLGQWSPQELYVNSTIQRYIFTFEIDRTVTYISNTDTTGTISYNEDTKRNLTLVKAYLTGYAESKNTDNQAKQYAQFLKATNNGTIKGMSQDGD